MEAQAPGLELQASDGVITATAGLVFINCWAAAPTVARLDAAAERQRQFIRMVGRHAVVTLVDPSTGREIDQAGRRRASEIGREMNPHSLARLFVVLADGFYAAVVRTVLTGVIVMDRGSSPYQVVSEFRAGATWLGDQFRRAGVPFDAMAYARVYQHVLDARADVAATTLAVQHRPEPEHLP